jgi:hypothetical protein
MGTTGTLGMAEAVNDGLATLTQAITWQLRSNHYPPVPMAMVPVAVAAVEALNEDDDRLIDMPEGVEFRDGRTAVEASVIAESFHLYGFVNDDLDWWDAMEDDDDE